MRNASLGKGNCGITKPQQSIGATANIRLHAIGVGSRKKGPASRRARSVGNAQINELTQFPPLRPPCQYICYSFYSLRAPVANSENRACQSRNRLELWLFLGYQ